MPISNETNSLLKSVPHVSGMPILGVLPNLLRGDPFEYLKTIMQKHGDFVALKLGPLTVYLVSSPAHLQHILRDNQSNYEKPEMLYRVLRKVMGNGLVISSGDFWLRQRRMIQPHLHRKQLPLLYQEIISAITHVLDSWEAGIMHDQIFDLHAEMSKITIEVISRTMFGNGVLSAEEVVTVTEMMNILTEYTGRNGYFDFLPERAPFPGKRKFEQALRTVQQIVHRLIERCREQGDSASGLIKMLFNTVDEATNEQMTDQQLFDEIMTIFAAGFETSASVLTWLWVVLDQHPEIRQKIQEEVDQVLGRKTPALEDLTQLEYSRKVLLELMRLYTVVPMLPRKAKDKDQFGTYEIPAGSFVLMFYHGVHHNPAHWTMPQQFDPERFHPEIVSQRHTFAYLPFSGGPRKCAGDEFALMEMHLAIVMIAQRFFIQLLPDQDFSPKTSITMRPHQGVKARITQRMPENTPS